MCSCTVWREMPSCRAISAKVMPSMRDRRNTSRRRAGIPASTFSIRASSSRVISRASGSLRGLGVRSSSVLGASVSTPRAVRRWRSRMRLAAIWRRYPARLRTGVFGCAVDRRSQLSCTMSSTSLGFPPWRRTKRVRAALAAEIWLGSLDMMWRHSLGALMHVEIELQNSRRLLQLFSGMTGTPLSPRLPPIAGSATSRA